MKKVIKISIIVFIFSLLLVGCTQLTSVSVNGKWYCDNDGPGIAIEIIDEKYCAFYIAQDGIVYGYPELGTTFIMEKVDNNTYDLIQDSKYYYRIQINDDTLHMESLNGYNKYPSSYHKVNDFNIN